MDKRIKTLLSISVIFGALILISTSKYDAELMRGKEAVKIGVIIPLTGDLAFIGEGIKRGMELAQQNQEMQLLAQYKLYFEDDQLDPKKSTSAAQKLISVDDVDVLVSISSGTGNAISAIAKQNDVIHIAMSADLKAAEGKYNFNHWTPPSSEVEALIDELQERGIKKVAIMALNQEGFQSMVDIFLERASGFGIEVSSHNIFNPGTNDFKTAITKSRLNKPDIYLLMAFTPELEILAKQMKEAGVTVPLTSIESFGITEERALFEGQWYVDAAAPANVFSDKYKEAYDAPHTIGAPNAYDIFNLVIGLSETMDGFDKDVFIREFKDFVENQHKSIFGDLEVLEEGIISSQASIVLIENGKSKVLKK